MGILIKFFTPLKAVLFIIALAGIYESISLAKDEPFIKGQKIIVTDKDWKAVDDAGKRWNTDDFDDSAWPNADSPCTGNPDGSGEHYTIKNVLGFPNQTQWIWATMGKGGHSEKCYVRKNIKVEENLQRAELVILADDTALVYINGLKVYRWNSTDSLYWGWKGCAGVVNILPFLRKGENIIAIKAIDQGGAQGLAAEIRLNHPSVREKLFVQKSAQISEALEKRMIALAKKLGSEDFEEREAATKELISVVTELGDKAIPFLQELTKNPDLEIVLRANIVLNKVFSNNPENKKIVFSFSEYKLSDLTSLLESDEKRICNLFRNYYSISKLMALEKDDVINELIKQIKSKKKYIVSRVLQLADFMEIKELIPEIRKNILSMETDLDLIWAISALGKMGEKEDIEALGVQEVSGSNPDAPIKPLIHKRLCKGLTDLLCK